MSEQHEWWICEDGFLGGGGRKFLGPFESLELALEVRVYVEKAEGRDGALWVSEASKHGGTDE